MGVVRLVRLGVWLAVVWGPAACKGRDEAPSPPATSDRVSDSGVTPVYGDTAGPPHPAAVELCDAVHGIPRRRRATCCNTTDDSAFLTTQCERALSAALAAGAIQLDPADVEPCRKASLSAAAGCDWVTPVAPAPPRACRALVKGLRPRGAPCRSSLECVEGSFCLGAGPTALGVCSAPLPPGRPCGTGVDALASFSGQLDTRDAHPECDGTCTLRRCTAATPLAGACTTSAACGRDRRCLAGRCAGGAHSSLGESCEGGSPCASGAFCRDGTCAALAGTGEACTSAHQCRGSCVMEPGTTHGTCAMQCSAVGARGR